MNIFLGYIMGKNCVFSDFKVKRMEKYLFMAPFCVCRAAYMTPRQPIGTLEVEVLQRALSVFSWLPGSHIRLLAAW
jgi:hypothetical protein